MTVIIDTAEGMKFFQLLQFEARFKIEISTGLPHKQPTLKLYNYVFGTKFSRKQQALDDVQRRILEAKLIKVRNEFQEIYPASWRVTFPSLSGLLVQWAV